MELSERILTLRKQKGLSQSELADLIGVSRQAVSKWESGQALPDLDKIIVLSDIFDISIDQLIKGNEEKTQKKKIDAMVFVIIATVLDVIALILSFNYFLAIPVLKAIPLILITIAFGFYILGIAISDHSTKRRAHRIFWSINIWIILFIILTSVFMEIGLFQGIWDFAPLHHPDVDSYIGNISPYSRLYAEGLEKYDQALTYFYSFWAIYLIGSIITIIIVNIDIIKRKFKRSN